MQHWKGLFLLKVDSQHMFFGANTHGILMHSGFRKYNWFWWSSLRFEVITDQMGHKCQYLASKYLHIISVFSGCWKYTGWRPPPLRSVCFFRAQKHRISAQNSVFCYFVNGPFVALRKTVHLAWAVSRKTPIYFIHFATEKVANEGEKFEEIKQMQAGGRSTALEERKEILRSSEKPGFNNKSMRAFNQSNIQLAFILL